LRKRIPTLKVKGVKTMGTRAIVQVINECRPDENITLYHHDNGDPDYMIPCLVEARKLAEKVCPGVFQYKFDRPGYVAGILCAADPGWFAPTTQNHGDLDYTYTLHVKRFDKWFVSAESLREGELIYMKDSLAEVGENHKESKAYKPTLRLRKKVRG
jgi:hypothetical protein